MMTSCRFLPRLACLAALAFAATGCATNRGILNVQVPAATAPASGPKAAVVRVDDKRVFEARPKSPSIPSLKGGEIQDASITTRAVARKRNGYGMAMGDILLPEGSSVAGLVKASLERALAEKGYTVVADASGADTRKVEAEIDQFWAWFSPGMFAAHLEFEAVLRIKGDAVSGDTEQKVRGYVRLGTQMARTAAWVNTFNKGLEDLNTNTKSALRAPGQ